MAATYYVGSKARLTVRFFDILGVTPTDPTTIAIKVRKADGSEASHVYSVDVNVVKESTGVYHYDQTLDQEGIWFYRGTGTGAVVAAAEKKLTVMATPFLAP